jgi:hypothetical protein
MPKREDPTERGKRLLLRDLRAFRVELRTHARRLGLRRERGAQRTTAYGSSDALLDALVDTPASYAQDPQLPARLIERHLRLLDDLKQYGLSAPDMEQRPFDPSSLFVPQSGRHANEPTATLIADAETELRHFPTPQELILYVRPRRIRLDQAERWLREVAELRPILTKEARRLRTEYMRNPSRDALLDSDRDPREAHLFRIATSHRMLVENSLRTRLLNRVGSVLLVGERRYSQGVKIAAIRLAVKDVFPKPMRSRA